VIRDVICEHCGQSYQTETSLEEMAQEMGKNFEREEADEGCVEVCDNCYQVLMARAREMGLMR
jgi:hypothetical protein